VTRNENKVLSQQDSDMKIKPNQKIHGAVTRNENKVLSQQDYVMKQMNE